MVHSIVVYIYIGYILESRIIIIYLPIASLLSPFLFIVFRRNYKHWFHVRNNRLRIRLGNMLLNIYKNIHIFQKLNDVPRARQQQSATNHDAVFNMQR